MLLAFLPALLIRVQGGLPSSTPEDNLQFEHLTREDGLPSDAVSAICQDSRGFMWFGTNDGLVRYDGYEMKVFKNDPNDPKSLSSNNISTIYEGRDGMLWVATEYALFCLNPETGALRRFLSNDDDPKRLGSLTIVTILEDRLGNIGAGSMTGLIKMAFFGGEKFDKPEISIRRYTQKDGLSDNLIAGILEDDGGRLWISTANGLSLFRNPSHNQSEVPDFKNYDLQDGLQGYAFNNRAFFKNAAGEMFFGGWQGLNVFHPDSIRDNPFLPPVVITSFESFDLDAPDLGPVPVTGISEKQELRLSYKNNIFSIGFAALSYRDGHNNKYAYQLEGFNDN